MSDNKKQEGNGRTLPTMGEEEAAVVADLEQDPNHLHVHRQDEMSFSLLMRAILAGICFGLLGLVIVLWFIRLVAWIIDV